MFVSIVIIGFSILLFLYWFRYTCLLILSTKTTKDYTAHVAQVNRLEFPVIQSCLQGVVQQEGMDALQSSLERDYRLLTGLLRHAAHFQMGAVTVEQRMLMVDYHAMRMWYAVARRFAQPEQARQALEEMTDIVAHFANAMGERTAIRAQG